MTMIKAIDLLAMRVKRQLNEMRRSASAEMQAQQSEQRQQPQLCDPSQSTCQALVCFV